MPDDTLVNTAAESARPTTEQFQEAAGSVAAAAAGTGGRRRRIRLIDAGWSKNGRYYPPTTLAEAARAGIYKAGTSMYIDHPTLSEQVERPERSVKDLAARLVTDAQYVDGALVAEADIYSLWAPTINEMADHIGVSIRAAGKLEYGEAEGREGPIVAEITEGISVDFVTSPARGGKILELIEAARTVPLAEASNVGAWLEARLHLAFTELADCMYGDGRLSRAERIGLSSAVGDALDAFVKRVESEQPQLYQRDRWQSAPDVAADSADVAVAEAAHPAPPAGQDAKTPEIRIHVAADGPDLTEAVKKAAEAAQAVPHTHPSGTAPGAQTAPGSPPADTAVTTKEKEGSMPELTEAEARKLTDERDNALAEAEKARNDAAAAATRQAESDLKLARFTAAESARPIAATLLAESGLPAVSQGRLIGELVRSETVPLTSDHALDESKFRTAVVDRIKQEQTYVASLAEQAGAGKPRDLGESTTSGGGAAVDPAERTKNREALIESYKARGLSDDAARLAANGRPN